MTSTDAHEAWRATSPGHEGRAGDGAFTSHAEGCGVPLRRTAPPPGPGRHAPDRFTSDLVAIRASSQLAVLRDRKQAFFAPLASQRTRYDHSVAVSRIAGEIAGRLGLHVDLARAIGLGHDCGHPPGGHAGEEALAKLVPWGFDHAPNGAAVVSRHGEDLGLAPETLEGIERHSWSRPTPATPEAQVAAVADRIEYTTGDLADGARIGLSWELSGATLAFLGTTVSDWRKALIADVMSTSRRVGYVALSPRAMAALHELREVCSAVVYLRPASVAENDAMKRVVASLSRYQVVLLTDRGFTEDFAWKVTVDRICRLGDGEACRIAVAEAGVRPQELPLRTAVSSLPIPGLSEGR